MMEIAVIIISALLILAVQMVIFARLARMSRRITAIENAPAPQRQRPARRDSNRRREKRPPRKPAEQKESSAPVGQADQSLRDINLRLKNAERDQEKARRRIQNNPLNEDEDSNHSKRRGRRKSRGNRRRSPQNNRRSENGREPSSNQDASSGRQETPPADHRESPASDPAAAASSQEQVHHDRRITVKRRSLDQTREDQPTPQSQNGENARSKEHDNHGSVETTSPKTESVSFGRR